MAERVLRINGREHRVDVDDEMPLLWVLRDVLGLTGTKFGCGKGLCRACTVHVDGRPTPSCLLPVSAIKGEVTTIEGFARDRHHPVLRAWREEQVPQCGFCQPAQILNAAALLEKIPSPSDDEINKAIRPHLCRCGTYTRIQKAIRRASQLTVVPPAATEEGG